MISGKTLHISRNILKKLSYSETDSPYNNSFIYQTFTSPPEDTADSVGMGPPSLYDNHGEDKWKKDIRRQGPRPGPVDPLVKDREISLADPGQPKEDVQGKAPDNTTPNGRDDESLQRDTLPVNMDEMRGDEVHYP